jgi:hypothetical protein
VKDIYRMSDQEIANLSPRHTNNFNTMQIFKKKIFKQKGIGIEFNFFCQNIIVAFQNLCHPQDSIFSFRHDTTPKYQTIRTAIQ